MRWFCGNTKHESCKFFVALKITGKLYDSSIRKQCIYFARGQKKTPATTFKRETPRKDQLAECTSRREQVLFPSFLKHFFFFLFRWPDISARCQQIEKGILLLQKDKRKLKQEIEESYYRDEHLNESVHNIQSVMEKCMSMILQAAEAESRPVIWNDLHTQMQEALKNYQHYLNTCPGRQRFLESQECFDRLTKVLKEVGSSAEEELKLTCCICIDAQVNCSAKCGHLFCATCAQSMRQCPICREVILAEHIRPVYFC